MNTDKIFYKIISSQYKDYLRIMLGDTEIIYIKTTKKNFTFAEQELRFMVDALNLIPTLVGALKSMRGIEAWITPSERHLTKNIYTAIDEYQSTSLGIYNESGTQVDI